MKTANDTASAAENLPKEGETIFDAANILLQRRMRFNPLRALNPENLSVALDQFDIGILRQAVLLWDAMLKRDDTLISCRRQLEDSIKSQDWQVIKIKGAPEPEASRHAAALQYFYDHVIATDAFDRNERGGRDTLIGQMMRAASYQYSVHHIVWKPQPGQFIEVDGAAPVPKLSAEMEHVPLWYFENTTGTLRFLPFGGFGIIGEELDWQNEWLCTTSTGLMFAASICYMFKRLSFQDWIIFNERYAQNKVVGMTPATKDSPQGQAFEQAVEQFNSDVGFVLYEMSGDKVPIQLLGPQGTTSVELFEKFTERQDRKLAVMYRGSDLSMMSRGGGKGGEARGASLQGDETTKLEKAYARAIAQAAHIGIDQKVIRFCFGEGVEPLARFSLPNIDADDVAEVRNSAGFLADRGVKVDAAAIADRLGIEITTKDDDALESIAQAAASTGGMDPTLVSKAAGQASAKAQLHQDLTANAKTGNPAQGLIEEAMKTIGAGVKADLAPIADRVRKLVDASDEDFPVQFMAFSKDLPSLAKQCIADPKSADAFYNALSTALVSGLSAASTANAQPFTPRSETGVFKRNGDVQLRTNGERASAPIEAAHLQPGDRVMIDDMPVNVKHVSLARHTETIEGAGADPTKGIELQYSSVHVHGLDDANQITHHEFSGRAKALASNQQ